MKSLNEFIFIVFLIIILYIDSDWQFIISKYIASYIQNKIRFLINWSSSTSFNSYPRMFLISLHVRKFWIRFYTQISPIKVSDFFLYYSLFVILFLSQSTAYKFSLLQDLFSSDKKAIPLRIVFSNRSPSVNETIDSY